MKTEHIMTIVAGAALAFVVWSIIQRKAITPASSSSSGASNIPNEALPGQSGWGWQYFTDGTAIGPDGAYYHNGVKVWQPVA